MVATSHQAQDYVFCTDCEHLFNKEGESWILRRVVDGRQSPLFDVLSARTPVSIAAPPDQLKI